MLRHNLSIAILAIFFLVAHFQITPTVAQDTLQCLQCDSTANAECITDLSKVAATPCADTTAKFCFTQADPKDGKVTRGCRVDTDPACTAPNCGECPTAGCNNHNICKTCDSSKEATCSQTDSTAATLNTVCAAANTQCLVNVRQADKHLERRCATEDDVKTCTDAATCKVCTGPNCNTGIFPANRINCYQCNSSDTKCGNVVTNSETIKSIPCLLYDANDKCYTIGDSETSMTRGCVSDTDTNVNKCTKPDDNPKCLACGTNNCNDPTYTVDQKLKCIQCTTTTDDKKCMWGQAVNDAKNCLNKVTYNVKGQCYTQTKEDVVHRGCLYDRDAALGECTTENTCTACDATDGCNNKDAGGFTCIRCRSDEKPECYNQADKLSGASCRNAVDEANASCFHGMWNNVVIRGCLVDADERQQAVCTEATNKQCVICEGNNCNTKTTSGATTMTVTTGLLSVILLALWRLY